MEDSATDAAPPTTAYGDKTMGVLRTAVLIDAEGVVVSVKHGVRARGNAERTLRLL